MLAITSRDSARAREGDLARLQLAGALMLGVLMPFLLGIGISPELLRRDLFLETAIGSALGILVGHYSYRNIDSFPGITGSYYVLPIFTSTFAAVLAVFLMLRLEYSRPLLLAGYGISVIWYIACYSVIQSRRVVQIAVLPFGRAEKLYEIKSVAWHVLDRPELPPGCSRVAADFHYDLPPEWEAFLAECALQGVSVLHYKPLRHSLTGKVEIEHLSENAYGSLIPNASYVTVKMVVDWIAALVVLILTLPVLLVVALLIRLDSPGPAIFRQKRVGYRGKEFLVWKFRTMRHSAPAGELNDKRDAAMTKDDDDRVTRLGRFLRRTRIDELPQLVNVLRCEMSWIGPRPEAEVLSRWYQAEIPFYRYRHIVRPGISGWAQISQGHVAELDDVLEKLNYDFYYISNFSPWLDVLIVFRTVKTMLTGFGAR